MLETGRKLAKELAKDCRTVQDIQNALKQLFKTTLEEIKSSFRCKILPADDGR